MAESTADPFRSLSSSHTPVFTPRDHDAHALPICLTAAHYCTELPISTRPSIPILPSTLPPVDAPSEDGLPHAPHPAPPLASTRVARGVFAHPSIEAGPVSFANGTSSRSLASTTSETSRLIAYLTPSNCEMVILFSGLVFALAYSFGKQDLQGGCAAGFGGSAVIIGLLRRARTCLPQTRTRERHLWRRRERDDVEMGLGHVT